MELDCFSNDYLFVLVEMEFRSEKSGTHNVFCCCSALIYKPFNCTELKKIGSLGKGVEAPGPPQLFLTGWAAWFKSAMVLMPSHARITQATSAVLGMGL